MNILSWNELSQSGPFADTPAAVTVGVFDGVHIGHRAVIDRVVRNGTGLMPVAVTFGGNPQNVLLGGVRVKDILTVRQKMAVIESLGVSVVVMIDFSTDFSKMSAKSFFTVLADAFRVKKIVEGDNFHFGSGREAGQRELDAFCESIGASLEMAPRVAYKGAPVSSTRLRHAIRSGQIHDVSAMLAGDFTVILTEESVVRAESGGAAVSKSGLSQVVPERGVFLCAVETGAGAREVVVDVDHERLVLREAPGEVKSISFKENIS
ncbi:MAG: FAD synthetase family protein [Spirochaetales bacterium]|nr:FAD synthetase family protein [Spirochaetales bacterium]